MIWILLNLLTLILWPRICTLPNALWILRFSSPAGVTSIVPGPVLAPGTATSNLFSWFGFHLWVVSLYVFTHQHLAEYSSWTLHRSPKFLLCELLSFLVLCPKNSSHLGLPGLSALLHQSSRFCLSSPSMHSRLDISRLEQF